MVTVNEALFCGQLALSGMHTFFMFYYVKVFLHIFNVDELWFGVAQAFFLLWNAVNDPLFGYAQDTSSTWFRCREKVISNLGPFLAASFLLLWFPWGRTDSSPYIVGCHLLIGLFIYDAFYSCIYVAWSALFAETTFSRLERVSAIKYSQCAILFSVNVVPITEKITGGLRDFFAFQCISVIIAIMAVLCFKITGLVKYQKKSLGDDLFPVPSSPQKPMQEFLYAMKIMKQILIRRDFRTIALTYFLHACRTCRSQGLELRNLDQPFSRPRGPYMNSKLPDYCRRSKRCYGRSTAHLNFAAIATEILIPAQVMVKGSWSMSLFYAACTLVPQLLVILSGNRIVKVGAASVVMRSFVASIVASMFLLLFGYNHPYLMISYMFFDSVAVHSVAPLYQVLLADYIDEDAAYFSRQMPISSTVYSLAALLVRPAQSIAPFIIVMVLTHYGYKEYQTNKVISAQLSDCMFYVVSMTTLLISTMQLIIFYPFLKGSEKFDRVDIFV